jgi:hypothetical protein
LVASRITNVDTRLDAGSAVQDEEEGRKMWDSLTRVQLDTRRCYRLWALVDPGNIQGRPSYWGRKKARIRPRGNLSSSTGSG